MNLLASYFLVSFTRANSDSFPPASLSISHCHVSVALLYAKVVWTLPSLSLNKNVISSPLRFPWAMACGEERPPPPVESSHKHRYSLDDASHSMKMIASYADWPRAFFSREVSCNRKYSCPSTHSPSISCVVSLPATVPWRIQLPVT